MAYRYYHGRTGIVWNVTRSAVGVVVNKLIGNRIRRKKIHVRIEHIKKSKCRQDFLSRVKVNDAAKAAAKTDNSKSLSLWTRSSKCIEKVVDDDEVIYSGWRVWLE